VSGPFSTIAPKIPARFSRGAGIPAIQARVGIVLLKRMVGREGVNPVPGIPFHADSNELLFVSIALTLTKILIDFDGA
jgi:hypothetical protein